MKRILQNKTYQFIACIITAIVVLLLLGSCSGYEEERHLTHVNGIVLNRRVNNHIETTDPFITRTAYQLYIYDGEKSNWYETNDSLYNALRPRDSISGYLLIVKIY